MGKIQSKLFNHDQFWVWHITTLIRDLMSSDTLELSTTAGNINHSKNSYIQIFLELSPILLAGPSPTKLYPAAGNAKPSKNPWVKSLDVSHDGTYITTYF